MQNYFRKQLNAEITHFVCVFWILYEEEAKSIKRMFEYVYSRARMENNPQNIKQNKNQNQNNNFEK